MVKVINDNNVFYNDKFKLFGLNYNRNINYNVRTEMINC